MKRRVIEVWNNKVQLHVYKWYKTYIFSSSFDLHSEEEEKFNSNRVPIIWGYAGRTMIWSQQVDMGFLLHQVTEIK